MNLTFIPHDESFNQNQDKSNGPNSGARALDSSINDSKIQNIFIFKKDQEIVVEYYLTSCVGFMTHCVGLAVFLKPNRTCSFFPKLCSSQYL